MRRIVVLSLLAAFILGCGTGEYESRLGTRKQTSKFDDFSAAEELPGTKVSVRVPSRFGLAPAHDDKRFTPVVFHLPGLKRTWEAFVKDASGGEQPYYCYFGVSAEPAANVMNSIRNELGNHPNCDIVEWQDFQGEKPDGRGNSWRKLRFLADQPFFYRDKDGKERVHPSLRGLLEVYVHESAGTTVIMAWRMPAALEASVGLSDLARLTAGSITVVQ